MDPNFYPFKLKAFAAISRVLDQVLDLDIALRDLLRILSENLSMRRATVTLADSETCRRCIHISHGLTPEEHLRGAFRLDEGATGRVFLAARPYFVLDDTTEPLFLDTNGARQIAKARLFFLGAPILRNGQAIGLLNVDRLFSDDAPPGEDIEFLQLVAALIAQFISLNDQVRARVCSLEAENAFLRRSAAMDSRGPRLEGREEAMLDVERQREEVAPCLGSGSTPESKELAASPGSRPTLKEVERNELVQALRRSGWIQYKAAEALGITPRQMGYRVKKHGLDELIARERKRD